MLLSLRDLLHNRPWLILAGAAVCLQVFNAFRESGTIYFFKYCVAGETVGTVSFAGIALTMGFDAVEEACVKGKAWLVMTASDASAKTVQRLNYAVGDLVDVITMPLTQDRLADISRKAVAVYAVTDRNLAKLCFDRLSDCGAIKNEEDMSE